MGHLPEYEIPLQAAAELSDVAGSVEELLADAAQPRIDALLARADALGARVRFIPQWM